MVESDSYVYTLRNYGQRINCSLLAMHPAKIQILSLTVGINSYEKNRYTETGTFHNVSKMQIHLVVENPATLFTRRAFASFDVSERKPHKQINIVDSKGHPANRRNRVEI